MHGCKCGRQRPTLSAIIKVRSTIYLGQDLQPAWSSSSTIGWLTTEPQIYALNLSPRTSITRKYHHTYYYFLLCILGIELMYPCFQSKKFIGSYFSSCYILSFVVHVSYIRTYTPLMSLSCVVC